MSKIIFLALTVVLVYSVAAAEDSVSEPEIILDKPTEPVDSRPIAREPEGIRGSGIGLMLGEPTGISNKLWIGGNKAIDLASGWSFVDKSEVHLHADFLLHILEIKTRPYGGIGVRVKLEDERRVGIRIPLGVSYNLKTRPLDVFFEIVPVLDLAPETKFVWNGSIGVRYF